MKMLNTRLVIGGLAAIVILVLFNRSQTPLETKRQAAFREWYEATIPQLENEYAPPQTISALTVRVKAQSGPAESHEYVLPGASGDFAVERERLARILQLIRESQIFAMNPSSASEQDPQLAVSIIDGEKRFETTVPYETISENIQIQNLLKLLELFGASSKNQEPLNPARL